MVRIVTVAKASLAETCGIKENDVLISINGKEINDVIDYRFYLAEEKLEIVVDRDGTKHSFSVEKEMYNDIGLDFETPLMDKKRRCSNKCIFCFIDQLPKGLRETLYFKDDDSRLSFLHGNYVTLTNIDKKEVDRIIEMCLPVNVSIHTTNPELRCKMMHNKRAGEVLSYLDDFANAEINMSGQIVLCRGVNDGAELERTLNDLAKYYPHMNSVSVVPSGLTKYREGLYPLRGFDKESAIEVIDAVEGINEIYAKKYGANIFFCSDEFYLLAEKKLPNFDYYEEFDQFENGVGMLSSFEAELNAFLKRLSRKERKIKRSISIATGVSAYDFICKMVKKIQRKCKRVSCDVYKIENDFFGHSITVAGLITGKDLVNQLKDKPLGDELLISRSMLRSEGDLFLCGMSLDELSNNLNVAVQPTDCDGFSFGMAVLGIKEG